MTALHKGKGACAAEMYIYMLFDFQERGLLRLGMRSQICIYQFHWRGLSIFFIDPLLAALHTAGTIVYSSVGIFKGASFDF